MASILKRVRRRILQLAAKREPAVVTADKRGVPTRVWSLDKYLKMKNLPRIVRPWEAKAKAVPKVCDPLGGIDADVRRPIRRDEMYE